jgi:hypothetical protein
MFEILSGILIAVGGGIGLYIWQRKVLERIFVKRIKSSSDKHVDGLLRLYERLFPEEDGTNYTIEERNEFMDARPEAERHVAVENIALVAILKEEVVGFILCSLYPLKRRKAIVTYFAVDEDNDEARLKSAGDRLLERLKTILIKSKKCDALFYELQAPDERDSVPERRKRRARRLLFRRKAKASGLKALEFQFPYQCAKVSLSSDVHESPFSLFCIGLREAIPNQVSKKQLLEYLEFIYLDCYGDLYPKDDPRFSEHQAHLIGMLEHYKKTLPEVVLAEEKRI